MLASPDQQISLTDPDSRSMATSGRGSGVVGYNVQVAVDTEHHLIVTHEVTNSGSDRAQLANVARQAKAVLKTESSGNTCHPIKWKVGAGGSPSFSPASAKLLLAAPVASSNVLSQAPLISVGPPKVDCEVVTIGLT